MPESLIDHIRRHTTGPQRARDTAPASRIVTGVRNCKEHLRPTPEDVAMLEDEIHELDWSGECDDGWAARCCCGYRIVGADEPDVDEQIAEHIEAKWEADRA